METLQAVAAQLNLDSSFIPLFVLVMIFYFVFSSVFLKPFQNLILDRRVKIVGAKEEATALIAKSEEAMQKYMASIRGSYDDAKKIISQAEQSAKSEEAKIVSEASLKAKVFAQNANAEMENQKKSAIHELQSAVPAIAATIVEKVLGRGAS